MTTESFDPNSEAEGDGPFGLPDELSNYKKASIICIPVPFEVTTSSGGGTQYGPRIIFAACRQVALGDRLIQRAYEAGINFPSEDDQSQVEIFKLNQAGKNGVGLRKETKSEKLIKDYTDDVNLVCERLNQIVYRNTRDVLLDGKIPAIIGGDHSVPLGAYRAAAERLGEFGIVHIDAHPDLLPDYQDYTSSHASVMRNALDQNPEIIKLISIGIRSYCDNELEYAAAQGERVSIIFDEDITANGWNSMCSREISNKLPKQIWLSFDIDGLESSNCPNTGTLVPGGLTYNQVILLMQRLVEHGHKIIGFDLVEVAPHPLCKPEDWERDTNAIVGANLLYRMITFTLASQGKAYWVGRGPLDK